MRPSLVLTICLGVLVVVEAGLYYSHRQDRLAWDHDDAIMRIAVAGLGLTDLCVATEARYTRHPAVSDPMAPFMDHPGAIEHFPTGSFWRPPERGTEPSDSRSFL